MGKESEELVRGTLDALIRPARCAPTSARFHATPTKLPAARNEARMVRQSTQLSCWTKSSSARRAVTFAIGVTVLAACRTLDRRAVNPPGLSPLVPAYSVVVRAGDVVSVSGMTGIKPGTQDIVEGGVTAQTRQAMENIRTALEAVDRAWIA